MLQPKKYCFTRFPVKGIGRDFLVGGYRIGRIAWKNRPEVHLPAVLVVR